MRTARCGEIALASRYNPRNEWESTCSATCSAACGGHTLSSTEHLLHSSASVPASRRPMLEALSWVCGLRPSDAQSTSCPLPFTAAAMEAPMVPGWMIPARSFVMPISCLHLLSWLGEPDAGKSGPQGSIPRSSRMHRSAHRDASARLWTGTPGGRRPGLCGREKSRSTIRACRVKGTREGRDCLLRPPRCGRAQTLALIYRNWGDEPSRNR